MRFIRRFSSFSHFGSLASTASYCHTGCANGLKRCSLTPSPCPLRSPPCPRLASDPQPGACVRSALRTPSVPHLGSSLPSRAMVEPSSRGPVSGGRSEVVRIRIVLIWRRETVRQLSGRRMPYCRSSLRDIARGALVCTRSHNRDLGSAGSPGQLLRAHFRYHLAGEHPASQRVLSRLCPPIRGEQPGGKKYPIR
jgi:hypothetical protein